MSELDDLLSGCAGIAGVQWVLSGSPMRKLLRRTLNQLLVTPHQLGRCHIRRAKFKPGRKLTAYFDLTVYLARGREKQDRDRSVRPIAVTWCPTDSFVSEKLSTQLREASDIQTEAARRGVAMPFQGLAGEAPACGMSVQVSPLDPLFPQLVRVSDPAYLGELLENGSLRAHRGSYTITPVRYRPGQRHVLRFDPLGKSGYSDHNYTLFAKLYADHRGERLFQVANWGADQLEKSRAGITGLRPLGYIAEEALVFYPLVEGIPLAQYLRRPQHITARYLYQAGAALRTLHDAKSAPPSVLKENNLVTEVNATARASEHVHALLPAEGTRISGMLEQVQILSTRLIQEPPTFVHGDFKADHLLISKDSVTLIDFDSCALADPALDIGKFLADLQWWYSVSHMRSQLASAQESFLAGYGLNAANPRMRRACLYEVLWLVKISLRRVRLFDPAWRQRTTQMLALAEVLLRA